MFLNPYVSLLLIIIFILIGYLVIRATRNNGKKRLIRSLTLIGLIAGFIAIQAGYSTKKITTDLNEDPVKSLTTDCNTPDIKRKINPILSKYEGIIIRKCKMFEIEGVANKYHSYGYSADIPVKTLNMINKSVGKEFIYNVDYYLTKYQSNKDVTTIFDDTGFDYYFDDEIQSLATDQLLRSSVYNLVPSATVNITYKRTQAETGNTLVLINIVEKH